MREIVMGLALTMPVSAVAGVERPVALKPLVELKTVELRVGDLAEVWSVRLPERVAAMVVMRMPRGGTTLDLPAEQVAALVRRRMPGVRPVVVPGSIIRIRMQTVPVEARAAGTCFAAVNGLTAGAVLSAQDVAAVPCRAAPAARLRYSRAGLVIAETSVPAGGYLGRLAALPAHVVGKGAELTLRSTSGPVTIERTVVALQPARSGGKLFVRDASGAVFAAPLALSAGGRAR